jgi:hypothetical protein
MNTELRRSKRYADFLPISVSVRNNDNSSQVAGPFSARIVDLSSHGACLLLTQVMMQSFHIFHSTREDDRIDLVLHINIQSRPDTIEILAQPVWLNATKLDDIKVFKMGVDFVNNLDDDLLQSINKIIDLS